MEEKKHIYNFDILKMISALLIVCHHYQQNAGISFGKINFIGKGFDFGYLVEMFFIISGFLTEYTYKENSQFIKWILVRLKRIYPYTTAACAAVLANAYVYEYLFHEPMFGITYNGCVIITSFLLVHTGWLWTLPTGAINNPTWYLCVLLLCYLIYIAVKKFIPEKICKHCYVFGIIAVLGGAIYIYNFRTIPFLGALNGRGYGSFFLGCFLCDLIRNADRKKVFAAAAVMMAFSIIRFYSNEYNNRTILAYTFFPSIVMTAYCLPQLSCKAVKTVGAISFEVYLWHIPVYGVLMTLFRAFGITVDHSYLTLFVFILIVVIFSTFIYFVYERSLSKLLASRSVKNDPVFRQ